MWTYFPVELVPLDLLHVDLFPEDFLPVDLLPMDLFPMDLWINHLDLLQTTKVIVTSRSILLVKYRLVINTD